MKIISSLLNTVLQTGRSRAAGFACLLIVLALPISSFCQSHTKLYRIKPKWQLGDQKKIHTEAVTKIFLKDSLFNHTQATANYSIRVIDTARYYLLLYANEPDAINIETKSSNPEVDSFAHSFADIITKIEKETRSFKYELLVDKNTGLALKVKNSDALLKMIEQIATAMLDGLGKKMQKSQAQIDSMQQKVVAYCKLAEPKILKTMMNEYDYIMQSYSYKFPSGSSITQKAMVHDVNALGEFGDVEMPALQTISSQKNGNMLSIHTDTDYDKEFLVEQMKKKRKNLSDLKASDIFLSEKEEATFKITGGWIISHKSNVVFEMKDVKVISETSVRFQ